MGSSEQVQCCCRWGDAVSGEWPEWECWDCPIHGNGLDVEPEYRCKRHTREMRNNVKRYRSRPTEVEAVQWLGDNIDEIRAFRAPIAEMCDPVWDEPDEDGTRRIVASTPNGEIQLESGKDGAQGWVPVPKGHWIVRQPGDLSDHWPCDPHFFATKYEAVEGV